VTAGNKYWTDGRPVGGEQFGYSYDRIGNRTSATINGYAAGYAVNALNQYQHRDVPGIVEVTGTASTAAHVTVNDGPVNLYGSYFSAAVPVDNSAGPVYEPIKVTAVKNNVGENGQDEVSQQNGHRYVAQTPEQFQYDADGNLTQDGRWIYTWDGENRLIEMQPISTVPAAAKKQLLFGYDYMGKRYQKQVNTWSVTSGTYQLASQSEFLYDGWNCIAETDGSGNLVRSYLWGSDLSGSVTGAGGVGGLLALTDHTSGANAGPYLMRYDGNGNVIGLVNGTNGSSAGRYVYGPFGEVVRASGAIAAQNPFQFSTKYTDAETGLNYYGYRYYNPSTGRWLRRDPQEEQGGLNLFTFVANDGINHTDALGLMTLQALKDIAKQLDGDVSGVKCCCKGESGISLETSPSSSGSSVTLTAHYKQHGCVYTHYFYWWDCYTASAEAGFLSQAFGADFHNYGYNLGGPSYTKTASPGFWATTLGVNDPYHLAVDCLVLYTYCGTDGYEHAKLEADANGWIWTWNKTTSSWTSPTKY